MGVNHSGQIHARNHDRITKIMYLIATVWHLATPFSSSFLFFPGLDLNWSRDTQKCFLRNKKIKFTDIVEVGKF